MKTFIKDFRPDIKLAPYQALEDIYIHRFGSDTQTDIHHYLNKYGCVIVDGVVYCNEFDPRYRELSKMFEEGKASTVKWAQMADATVVGRIIVRNRYGYDSSVF